MHIQLLGLTVQEMPQLKCTVIQLSYSRTSHNDQDTAWVSAVTVVEQKNIFLLACLDISVSLGMQSKKNKKQKKLIIPLWIGIWRKSPYV